MRFPHLALNGLALQGKAEREPLLVLDDGDRVHDANRAARRSGVVPGMLLAEALACLPVTPRVRKLSVLGEARLLEPLVPIVHRYSSWVVPEVAHGRILFEACGSRRLFGDLPALRHALLREFEGLGYGARCAVAPTPAIARLLAGLSLRQQQHLFGAGFPEFQVVTWPELLRQVDARRSSDVVGLLQTPIAAIESLQPYAARLRAVGIHRLGALLRLPRGALARRHGPECVAALERFLGERSEALPAWKLPEIWEMRLPLADVEQATALQFPLQRMLRHLQAALDARASRVRRLTLNLLLRPDSMHDDLDTEPRIETVVLDVARPTACAQRWMSLWRTRLESLRLSAPVRECRLLAAAFESSSTESVSLPFSPAGGVDPGAPRSTANAAVGGSPRNGTFPERGAGVSGDDWGEAVAPLRARLGAGAVYRLTLSGFPAPEQALVRNHWRVRDPDAPQRQRFPVEMAHSGWLSGVFGTPLWVLPEGPVRLASPPTSVLATPRSSLYIGDHDGDHPGGVDVMVRLEGGWWCPGADVRRDYCVFRAADGRWCWGYRDLRSDDWWLQGYWG